MKQYQDMLYHILKEGSKREDRTGTGTIGVFGYQNRYDLSKGFPLMTTKKTALRIIFEELKWFLNGDTNIKYLLDKNVNIWNADAYRDYKSKMVADEYSDSMIMTYNQFVDYSKEHGYDLGSVYGKQWRNWQNLSFKEPVLLEWSSPQIETPFIKDVSPNYDSNESGLIGEIFSSKTGEYTVIKEYKIERSDGAGKTWRFDVQFNKTGYISESNIKTSVLKGQIRDRYYPSSVGVGAIGEEVSEEDRKLLYQTWIGMLKRCYDKNHSGYENYGGKGVFVHREWLIFSNFVKDVKRLPNWIMKLQYPHDYSLDKDFYASNCYSSSTVVWASKVEQTLNSEKVSLIKVVCPSKRMYIRKGVKHIGREFNLTADGILSCLRGEKSNHKGWEFSYLDEAGLARVQIFDQIKKVIAQIKHDPYSRKIILSSWNVGELEQMTLEPCHTMVQFYVADGKLSCQLYQRSADTFLGVPFNIASYSMLVHMIAHVTGLEVGEFIHTFGDAHIYLNHIEQVKEQLLREPKELPTLKIVRDVENIDDFVWEDFELIGYDPHPAIKGKVSVGE